MLSCGDKASISQLLAPADIQEGEVRAVLSYGNKTAVSQLITPTHSQVREVRTVLGDGGEAFVSKPIALCPNQSEMRTVLS